MSWSAEQQRLLGAMGYTLFQQAGQQQAARGPAPIPNAMAMPIAGSKPAPERAVTGGNIDKLLAALQRTAPGHDVVPLAGDIEALRRDPGKKRALWPRLRALRRAH